MQSGTEAAWLFGTAYVAGLALLGIVMLIRGHRNNEVGGAAFPSLLSTLTGSGSFTPSMRDNPDRVN